MAIFGNNWTDDYISGSSDAVLYEYGEPIFKPIHVDEDYDSTDDYEHGIKHFQT